MAHAAPPSSPARPASEQQRRATRRRWLSAALASFLALSLCVGVLIVRVREFNRTNPTALFAIKRVHERDFTFAGRPVSLVDAFPAGTPKDARHSPQTPAEAIILTYGDATARIPVQIPPTVTLPDLIAHNDWLRVIRMIDATGIGQEEALRRVEAGQAKDRLIIVARVPPALPPGESVETWGKVWKKQWTFDIYELLPDGTIHQERRLRYPTGGPFRAAKDGELQQNTWQFSAALTTMPQAGGVGPTTKFFNNALRAANWTLPASMFCGLALSISLAFAFAPPRRTPESDAEEAAASARNAPR